MRITRMHPGEEELARSLLTGIVAFRWVVWAWMAAVLAIDHQNDSLAHPGLAWTLVAAALACSVWATLAVRSGDAGRLMTPAAVGSEAMVALALVSLDPWLYQSVHSQKLGASFALAAIISAGVAFAGRGGVAVGLTIGMARAVGVALDDVEPWNGDQMLSVLSSIVLYAIAGGVAGFAAIKLREAERTVADARAREDMARTLHDGVLQTLAVIQRRSDDDELVGLAREQEHDLRRMLAGEVSGAAGLVAELRDAAARHESLHGGRVTVVAVDDLGRLPRQVIDAVAGAASEALTNAAKHGGATAVTIYAEPDGRGVFCSVKDDGTGFDLASTPEGVGLSRSIRGRMEDVGGRVEVSSDPGRGTEIRLYAP